MYGEKHLANPAAIVDANHSNSNKQFKEQIRIVSEVLHSRNYNTKLKELIKGVMIESYLEEGCQSIGADDLRKVHYRPVSWMGRYRAIDL